MIVFIASAISFLLLAVSCYQIYRAASAPEPQKEFCLTVLLGAVAVTLGIGCVTGSETEGLLMLEILPALAIMLVFESSFVERKKIQPAVYALAGFYLLPAGFHIAVASGLTSLPAEPLVFAACTAFLILPAVVFIAGICRRIRDVKMILKTGTVWANLSLAVEAVYVSLYLLLNFLYIVLSLICSDHCRTVLLLFPFLAGLMLAALGVRSADNVLFVFWRVQERRVVESMKVTKVETAMDPMSIEDVYQDIYERVVAYFETEKPFLNNELTINDLSKALYSNKLYLSRAISQFTGRNFCQFVNYHRVTYSMELFRKDPDLKIQELAARSGFNSDVSYNMAFRLFMGETPGEWCRKERTRKIKMKK
jgi:AraC-like DNA-binding protein